MRGLFLSLLPFLSLTWNTKIIFVHLKTKQSKNKQGKPRDMVLLYSKSKPLRISPYTNMKTNDEKRSKTVRRLSFQKIWVVFLSLINSVALTLYFASLSLSFLIYKVETICPAPHTTNYWCEYQERECF